MEPRFKIEGPSRQLSAHKHIKHCAVCWECGHDLTIMYEQMLVLSFHCGNWRALHQHDAELIGHMMYFCHYTYSTLHALHMHFLMHFHDTHFLTVSRNWLFHHIVFTLHTQNQPLVPRSQPSLDYTQGRGNFEPHSTQERLTRSWLYCCVCHLTV